MELTDFRSATVAEVLAVHRQPYLELLQRIVASKAPCDVESAPTYATASTYEDAFHVRVSHLLALQGLLDTAGLGCILHFYLLCIRSRA